MVDRNNANFLLWPPCEEVQRCSGCCRVRNTQCVSNATNTRNVEVTKIVFNERPTFAKVVVSVVDHMDCTCQLSPSPALLKKRDTHRLHSHLHRHQILGPAPAQGQVRILLCAFSIIRIKGLTLITRVQNALISFTVISEHLMLA
ncbi:platelet-derived growth factor subunit B-like [Poecilia reticulata]|nr:PREDICTED: platelet-derived growth factor subunit B-like [Poecilia reticulata]